jgi:hypothetical protein
MRKPSWGLLYLLAALLMGLLGLVEAVVPAGARRRTLEIVIAVVVFAAMHLWVGANRRALDMLGERDHGFRRAVDEPARSELVGRGRDTGAPSPHRAEPSPRQRKRAGPARLLRLRPVEDVVRSHVPVPVGHRRRVE